MVAVVVGVVGQCWSCAAYIIGTMSFTQAIANGASFGGILKGAAVGLVSNGLPGGEGLGGLSRKVANGLGAFGKQTAGQFASVAVASGISAKAMGGKFIDGVKGAAIGLAIAYGVQRLMVGETKAESFAGKESPQQGQASGGDKNSTSLNVSEVADINGGTADQVAGITNDLKDIFGTERGQEMLDTLNTAGKKVTININDQGVLNGGDFLVNIDPNSHPIIETTAGLIPASTRRILAHELGNAVMGAADNGPNNMNNVINNENRIMGELGRPRRTAY